MDHAGHGVLSFVTKLTFGVIQSQPAIHETLWTGTLSETKNVRLRPGVPLDNSFLRLARFYLEGGLESGSIG